MTYISSATDQHEFIEEHDWVEIISSGPETYCMLLIFVQKLCTAFHEYGPAYQAGIINPQDWTFVCDRLANRISKVIKVAYDNNLGELKGIDELRVVLQNLLANPEMPDLMELAEEVHQITHHIYDELMK